MVVTLYGVLAYAGFRIARRAADRFIQLASVAITVWLIGQAAMNMGYVVGLLPVTGVQLPLISAGGTSLVLTLFIVGLLARFARAEPAAIEGQRTRARGRLARLLLPVPAAAVEPVRPPPAARRQPRAGRRGRARRPPTARARSRRRSGPRPPAAAARVRRGARAGRGDRPMTRPLSVVLAGGGTGGHIEPMLALADALRRRATPAEPPRITCLGTARGMETRLVPARGYDLAADPAGAAAAQAHPRPAPRARPGAPRGRRDPRRCSTSCSADVVVGFGGYVALPAYLAARRAGGYRSSSTSRTRCRAWPTGSGPGSPPGWR